MIAFIWADDDDRRVVCDPLTGRYPDGLYQFGVGSLRWTTRVNAYALLLVDEYPPFSLD